MTLKSKFFSDSVATSLSFSELVNSFQFTAIGEAGVPVVSVLGVVEEENNISPGTVTLLLQLMGGITAGGNILIIKSATLRHAVFQVIYNLYFLYCIIGKRFCNDSKV